jgi:hypothetical protein
MNGVVTRILILNGNRLPCSYLTQLIQDVKFEHIVVSRQSIYCLE